MKQRNDDVTTLTTKHVKMLLGSQVFVVLLPKIMLWEMTASLTLSRARCALIPVGSLHCDVSEFRKY